MKTAQLPARQLTISQDNLLFLLLFVLAISLLSTGAGVARAMTFGAAERNLEIDFSFDPPVDATKQLVGYRLYKDGVPVCTLDQPSSAKMACALLTADGTFNFTLTAYYDDKSESSPSPAYPFVVSSTHSVDFSWQVASGSDNQGGFRLYDNGVLVQEISDPAARQLTYTSEFTSASHSFTIAGVDGSGAEKDLTGALSSKEVYPPTAVLSSSTGAGNAPLAVTFNGSSSTAINTPLVKYSWVFGDGAQGTGATVSHTFTTPGTYYTKLTVEDSLGLTDTVTTPIVVGQAPAANQKPTAVIAADPAQGAAPLKVSFDASQSSDPDGSITGYSWDFGDGTTGSGATVQHTYATSGDFTASLVVTDDKGATASTSKQIRSGNQLPLEVGEVSIDQQWVKVLFDSPFVNPVVIAGTTTVNGTDPVTVRIRNIDSQGFEIRLQEWDYQDGTHEAETVNYLVIEKGVYTLDDGSKLEAGTFTGRNTFAQVDLQQTYAVAPVILTQVASTNKAEAVTGRVRNTNGNSFEFRLQEMELTENMHAPETIGYLAWQPGKGETSGFRYEIGVSGKDVTQNWFDLAFQPAFPDQPAFLAGMQTFAGSDTATVRNKEVSAAAAKVKVEEEQSYDAEVRHNKEVIGYLVIGTATAAVAPAQP